MTVSPTAKLASCCEDLSYTLRRYYVDEFQMRRVADFSAGSRVLDLGGNKIDKRGRFDIEEYDLEVTYANYVTDKQPDVQTDAARLPFKDGAFDAVICAELLEHVRRPDIVLAETFRVLKPGGRLLLTAPFLVQVHADPEDFGRYTDHYWRLALRDAGFKEIEIEQQGRFWSVLADMFRVWLTANSGRARWRQRLLKRACLWLRRKALAWDNRDSAEQHRPLASFTTGFGVAAIKESLRDD